jgi:folylpolyglutamate synthase
VGIGGEYSATNFIRQPIACGVTSMHVEHVEELGHTVEEIAWHKAGIARVRGQKSIIR